MRRSNLQNYQIFQRNRGGYADVRYQGTASVPEGGAVYARVQRECDMMTIIPYTPCDMKKNADGSTAWSVDLRVPEGGLYRFEAIGGSVNPQHEWSDRIDCVYHIGVGDIFIMAGQSNMTGYGRDAAYDPPTLGVHAFTRRGTWDIAVHPLSDSLDNIYGYGEYTSASSPALSFARRLHENLGVPVGLIPAAVGGTMLTQWEPTGRADCYDKMMAMVRDAKGAQDGQGFRGMIWFQGCSDCIGEDGKTYFDRFETAVSHWREALGDFPIVTVQLNRWMSTGGDGPDDAAWGRVRDAQRRAALEIPGISVVPALDLPCTDGIHDSAGANVIIGERLAMTALACIYGKPGQTAPSVLSAEAVDDNHIRVNVTPGHRVYAMDNIALGMDVEDDDGIIRCTTAEKTQDALIVTTEKPYHKPAHFHYAWRAQAPTFAVRDNGGMPLLACYGIEIK